MKHYTSMGPDTREMIKEKGSYVKIRYTLYTNDGEVIKGNPTDGLAFLEFFAGYDQVLPALERELVGRSEKEKLRISIPPEDAFGLYDSGLIKRRRYEDFPEGRGLQEGKWVLARDERTRTSYGYFVREKGEEYITLDYNHPLAGKSLVYDLEVVEVREASASERALLRPCESGERPSVPTSGTLSHNDPRLIDTEE